MGKKGAGCGCADDASKAKGLAEVLRGGSEARQRRRDHREPSCPYHAFDYLELLEFAPHMTTAQRWCCDNSDCTSRLYKTECRPMTRILFSPDHFKYANPEPDLKIEMTWEATSSDPTSSVSFFVDTPYVAGSTEEGTMVYSRTSSETALSSTVEFSDIDDLVGVYEIVGACVGTEETTPEGEPLFQEFSVTLVITDTRNGVTSNQVGVCERNGQPLFFSPYTVEIYEDEPTFSKFLEDE